MSVTTYSIIIPHYNIPDLLMRCLKSIPVREDVQVIVVDDCSPDADTYLDRYPELSRPYLEFYSTEKGGSAGRARNVGLNHASGTWLIFADADDLFSDSFAEILDDYKNENNDIIFFNCSFVKSDDINSLTSRGDEYFIKRLFDCDNPETFARCDCPVPWGKIIRHSLVNSAAAKFSSTRWSNDILFSTTVGCAAKSLTFVNRQMYIATTRDQSLTSAFCSSKRELLERTVEALRSQSIIEQYGYNLHEMVIIPYLHRALMNDGKLFWTVVHDLNRYGISRFQAIMQLVRRTGCPALLKSILSVKDWIAKDVEYFKYIDSIYFV